jgi:hypothetical protein
MPESVPSLDGSVGSRGAAGLAVAVVSGILVALSPSVDLVAVSVSRADSPSAWMAVAVACGVRVAPGVRVAVGVCVAASVAVGVCVAVGSLVPVAVAKSVAVRVSVTVGVGVSTARVDLAPEGRTAVGVAGPGVGERVGTVWRRGS